MAVEGLDLPHPESDKIRTTFDPAWPQHWPNELAAPARENRLDIYFGKCRFIPRVEETRIVLLYMYSLVFIPLGVAQYWAHDKD